METCFNYNSEHSFFSSDERKWITRIHKLKEQYPELVTVLAEPESNDGCIYCRLPNDWLQIRPKYTKNLTDQQRQALSDRMMKIHHAKILEQSD